MRAANNKQQTKERQKIKMMTLTIIGLLAVLTCIGLAVLFTKRFRRGGFVVANIAEGRHTTGNIAKLTDAAHTTRYLVVKRGSDDGHVAIANAQTDVPYGVCTDEAAAAEAPVNIFICGPGEGTVFMVATGAIAVNDWLFVGAAGAGKVSPIAGTAGTYFPIGRALTAATTSGDLVEVATHPAIKFVQ
jgi:hypothetical protein